MAGAGDGVATNSPAHRFRAGEPVRAARLFINTNPTIVTAWCSAMVLVLASGATFYAARSYLLPIVAAFVLSILLAPPASVLEHRRVPRSIAAGAVVVGLCGLIYVAFTLVAAPAARWVADSPELLSTAREHLERIHSTVEAVEEISQEVEDLTRDPEAQPVVLQGPDLTSALAASARTIIVQTLFVLIMTYFFLATRAEVRLKAIAAQPRLAGRLHVARVFRDVERRVAVYITTLSAVNLGLGSATALGLWALGVPSPIMWGGLAAALNFVPYVGPAVMTVLLAAVGLMTFETLAGAAMAPGLFVVLNFVESNMVTPLVLGRRMTLNPLAILLAVSFWTWLWGPVGGVLSIPMLIMAKVLCDHTTALRPVGEFIGGPLPRHGDRPGFRALRARLPRVAASRATGGGS